VTVTLSATDGSGSGVDRTYFTTDGTTPTTGSSVYDSTSKPVLHDGEQIKYFSVDQVANAEAMQMSGAAKVDTTTPSTSDNVPAGFVDHDVTVTLTAGDTGGSGVDRTYYTTDGTIPTTGSAVYDPASKPVLRHGERIRYFTTDNAGNAETARTSDAAQVDTQAPSTRLDSAYVSDSHDATFGFGADDGAPSSGGLTYRCRLDSDAYQVCTSPKTFTGLPAGDHSFEVEAADAAGNVDATPTHYAFTVASAATTGTVADAAGGTVSTDPGSAGPTADDPVQTEITIPVAGTVTITETTPAESAPTGFSFLDRQFQIEAPVATETEPLKLVFKLAATGLPEGATADSVTVYRNGAAVDPCTGSGTATPDPCVSERRTLTDGTIVITVLAIHASTWNLAVPAKPTPPATDSTPPSYSAPSSSEPSAAGKPTMKLPPWIARLRVLHRCVREAILSRPHPGTTGMSFSFWASEDVLVRYDILRRVKSPAWPVCPPTGGTVPITFAGVWHSIDRVGAGKHDTTLGATASVHKRRAVPARAGGHRVSLAPIAAGRKLSPGTYLLRITAMNADGVIAKPVTVKFWVLKDRSRQHTPRE
jgi:hypothetical protein